MAYETTSADGRVIGDYILIGGKQIRLDDFATMMGHVSWQELVRVSPVASGKINVSKVYKTAIAGTPAEMDAKANEISNQLGVSKWDLDRDLQGFPTYESQAYIQNKPQTNDAVRAGYATVEGQRNLAAHGAEMEARSRSAAEENAARNAIRANSSVPAVPDYQILPVGDPGDIGQEEQQYYLGGNPDFDESAQPEPEYHILTSDGTAVPSGLDTSGDAIMASYATKIQQDAIAGGNITDIASDYQGA